MTRQEAYEAAKARDPQWFAEFEGWSRGLVSGDAASQNYHTMMFQQLEAKLGLYDPLEAEPNK